ncbi:MAG: tRNA epoxyqueuosine(34) reductase QueG [Bacteroidetes bacterium]|nr:tRNA epoxyqueuosine(34) reductase QueG [Bacteroidota bacterium]
MCSGELPYVRGKNVAEYNQAEADIKAKAHELGFSMVGIASAGTLADEGARLKEWLQRGYQGSMAWMERRTEKRSDPREILPGAMSVVCVAVNYYTPFTHRADEEHGKISRYAWGEDYHLLMGRRLEELRDWMTMTFAGSEATWYVDTGPVLEKAWAQLSGIGWQGKHTNVISREFGSWIFLGEIITTLSLRPDPPATDHCGSCTLCIEACPTGAIVEPYLVDSRRCLSYLTIEHRAGISGDVTAQFDGWIYGCDVCQDVCPWNEKFSRPSQEEAFMPREDRAGPRLDEWSRMSREEFADRFRESPIRRTKWEGLMRNIGIVRDHPSRRTS